MEQLPLAAQEQAQGVESSILVVVLTGLHRKSMEQRSLHQQHRAEVEVVANAALEVVDGGVSLQFAVFQRVVVGIDHRGIRVAGHAEHTVERTLSQRESRLLGDQQGVVSLGVLSDAHQRVAAREARHLNLSAIADALTRL